MSLLKLPKSLNPAFRGYGVYNKPSVPVTIDWNNPLTERLTGYIPFSDSQGFNNIVRPDSPLEVLYGGIEISENTGKFISGVDTDCQIKKSIFSVSVTFNHDATIVVIMSPTSAAVGTNDKRILTQGLTEVTTDSYLYIDNTGTEGRLATYVANTASKITVSSPEPDFTGNIRDNYALTYNEGDSRRDIYLNGGDIAGSWEVGGSANWANTLSTDYIYLFSTPTTAHRWEGEIHAMITWDRQLSAEEIAEVYENPYQFLKPINDPVYILSTFDGGVTNRTIDGDVTITSTPNATLDYTQIADLSGDVTITSTPNATMLYEVLSEIMGTTTISVTPSSSFDYTVSSNHTITGDVTVTAIANATLEYAVPALTMESDDFDSAIGNVSSITDAATLTPVINLVPDDQSDVPGWLMLCVRSASNMSGKTPEFVFDDVDCRFTGVQKPCWQYLTDDRNTWRAFDNVAAVGTIVTCSMNTPFTGEVEFATKPRWHYSDTQDFIAEVALNANAHELASSVAASGLPTNVHASIDPGATNANSFPQQDINLYGIRISNDAATPDVGDKWPIVLLMGAHASEDQGNYMLQGFVDFLLGGSTLANRLLVEWDVYIYDVNPHGRAYGKERWSENDTTNTDLNRAWDGVPSGTAVADIITAIGTDLSGPIKAMIDYHGNFQATTPFGAFYDSSNPYDVDFKTRMGTKVTGTYPYYGDNVAGTSGEWALNEGALFAPTQEAEYYPDGHPIIATMYDSQGQAVAETLDEMRLEEVGTYAVSGDVTITSTPNASFEVAGSSGIIGDLTVTLTPNATVAYNVNSVISGDVTITSIPNATLDYNVNSDISGDVTITLTSNPALEHNVNATITGDVTITAIPSAALEVSGSSGIFGDVTVSLTPNSSLNYNLNADISGDITATLTPNSTLAFSNGNELVGDVTVTLTSDSTLEFSNNFAVIGNIPISLTPNATMSFAGGNGIEGDITYTITPASALDYTKNAEIVGNITYNLTPTSSLIFEFASVISPVKNLEVLNASTIVLDVYVNI